MHFHNSYEIVFVKNGHGKIIVNNGSYDYDDGALIFLGPCVPHFGFSNNEFPDNFEIVIHFDEQFVQERIKLIPEFSTLLPVIKRATQVILFGSGFKNELTMVFEEIYQLNSLEQLASILNILCKFVGSSDHSYLLERPQHLTDVQTCQANKIFDYISTNFSKQISTKDAAQHASLTTNSFCKVFKKLTGQSFISYLNQFRIHRAVQLIELSDDSISEIAYKCGFENLSYFSRVFYQVKKLRPNDYKKKFNHLRSL